MKLFRFVFVLYIALLFSCSSNQTPTPQPPVPPIHVPICGDHSCDAGENHDNCPADCKEVQPPPIPKPEVRDHSRMISFGAYSLLAQSNVDMKAFFDGLPKQVNYVRVFGLSGWLNYEGFYPPNVKYYAKVKELFTQAALHDVGVEWVMFTGYLNSDNWSKYSSYGLKNTPYCRPGNTDWCKDTTPLFRNWNHQNPLDPKNFAWLFWTATPKDVVLSVKGVGKNGQFNIDYVRNIADIAKGVKGLRILVEPLNEPFVVVDSAGKTIDGKFEADVRIENWIDSGFAKRGFVPNQYYHIVNNDAVLNADRSMNLGLMLKNALWLKARNKYMEVHACDSKVAQQLIDKGFPMAYIVCSSDGIDDGLISKEARATYLNKKVLKMDISASDAWAQPFNNHDIKGNLKKSMPKLAEVVK